MQFGFNAANMALRKPVPSLYNSGESSFREIDIRGKDARLERISYSMPYQLALHEDNHFQDFYSTTIGPLLTNLDILKIQSLRELVSLLVKHKVVQPIRMPLCEHILNASIVSDELRSKAKRHLRIRKNLNLIRQFYYNEAPAYFQTCNHIRSAIQNVEGLQSHFVHPRDAEAPVSTLNISTRDIIEASSTNAEQNFLEWNFGDDDSVDIIHLLNRIPRTPGARFVNILINESSDRPVSCRLIRYLLWKSLSGLIFCPNSLQGEPVSLCITQQHPVFRFARILSKLNEMNIPQDVLREQGFASMLEIDYEVSKKSGLESFETFAARMMLPIPSVVRVQSEMEANASQHTVALNTYSHRLSKMVLFDGESFLRWIALGNLSYQGAPLFHEALSFRPLIVADENSFWGDPSIYAKREDENRAMQLLLMTLVLSDFDREKKSGELKQWLQCRALRLLPDNKYLSVDCAVRRQEEYIYSTLGRDRSDFLWS